MMAPITFAKLKAMTSTKRPVDTQEENSQDAPSNEDRKRNRHANWRLDEVKELVDAIEPVYQIISGPHSMIVSEQEKQKHWLTIQSKVNAVSNTPRTIQACENKWSDYKSRVKAKVRAGLRQLGGTGGGEADHIPMDEVELLLADVITSNEKKVMHLLGPTCIFGVKGGLDTSVPAYETNRREFEESGGLESTRIQDEVAPEDYAGPAQKKSKSAKSDPSSELLSVQKNIMEATQKMATTFGSYESGLAEVNKNLCRVATALEELLWFQKFKMGLEPSIPSSQYVINFGSNSNQNSSA